MDTNGYQQDARQACNLPYLAGASSSTTPASAVPGARERERGKEEERVRKGGKEREYVCTGRVFPSDRTIRPPPRSSLLPVSEVPSLFGQSALRVVPPFSLFHL